MRVFTRGDLDGLTSCVLLTIAEDIGEIVFAHPKDMQDGLVEVMEGDIIVNLPYVEGCSKWFDHHISEDTSTTEMGEFDGRFEVAPSAARVIAHHYNREDFKQFEEMLSATDKLDAANLDIEDVTNPKNWILLGFTLDPRSGFGPEFQKYFRWLVEYVKELPLDMVIKHPEVKKRCERVYAEQEEFKKLLSEKSSLDENVIITDLRETNMRNMPVGNRFLVYTLFPDALSEMRIFKGKLGTTVLAVGHSIFNRSSSVNIGDLMHTHGGGGHRGAGTCQVPPNTAEDVIASVLETLKKG